MKPGSKYLVYRDATGGPQIVPRHSASAELWDGAAELLEPAGTTSDGLVEVHLVTAQGLADALERLYTNCEHYQELPCAGYERATDQRYSWDRVALQWKKLFEELPA